MTSFRLAVLSLAFAATAFAAAPLTVDVFAAGSDGFFVTSTLVSGERDAVLIDGQFTLSEAHRLTAVLLESKKNLKTIFITHAHPDHFFGLEVIKAQFPNAEVLTTPAVAAEMKVITPAKLLTWKLIYGTNLTNAPVTPRTFAGGYLDLEGQRLDLISLPAGESETATVVWVPSIRTAVVGDLAFNRVHVWLAETNPIRRENWLRNLAKVKALDPRVVVSGHEAPGAERTPSVLDDTAAYLRDFNAAILTSKTADELEKKMLATHADWQLPEILSISSKAALPGPKS